ncbi:hypothetical protein B0J13DRAFT_580965 [Dactylonectria estremocensis]|uniref:High affinity methionine permease n=1 Tax=Dactylonectria estremocensis TaxID=1079267 RepID=A0A9P9FF14_9HYPO|nr:hypothetical protein B0J13DRAFT_580965 [Dactylonectria estremocensis]
MSRPSSAQGGTELADLPREGYLPPQQQQFAPQLQPLNVGPFKPRPSPEDADPTNNWIRGALETFDVFALIVNKMIGTGIYSAPATVFLLTGNKSLTLGLFSIGFIYTLISMVMYLDFAEALPFTGGELVYVSPSEIPVKQSTQQPPVQGPPNHGYNSQQRVVTGISGNAHPESTATRATPIRKWKRVLHKFLGDGLLSYISFSMSFIGLFNSGTNSMQTGRMILICIASTPTNVKPDVNLDAVRLIAVCTLTALCLLQYFSPEFGRKLNQALAVVKIIFCVALIIVAIVASAQPLKTPKGDVIDRAVDWNVWHKKNPRMSFAKALLAVLFSFEGWENATFLHSTAWEDISGVSQNVNYAPMLSGNGVTARRAWAVLAAISSLGSLNSIIYTFSRVKQAIGQAEVLPWSIVWKKDDILQRERDSDHPGVFLQKAPQGGLIIHWTMSVVVIAGSSSIESTLESVGLPGYVQTYAHCFILMIIGAAYLNLSSREDALARPAREPIRRDTPGKTRKPPFRPSKMTSNVGQWVMMGFVGLYVALNGAILIINAIPPYVGSDGTSNAFKGFGFPIIILSILTFGIAYYVLVFGAAPRVYPIPGHPEAPPIVEEGLFSPNGFSFLRLANVKCEIRKDRYFNPELDRVRRFGRRWRIVFSVPGDDPVSLL